MNQSAETWFFLRGLVRESGHWSGFLERFQKAFPERRIIPLDLPGSGVFFREPSPLSVPGMTDLLRAEFERHKGAENHLFAVSLGAMVGIDWLQRYPDDFNGAVVVNTSLRGLSPFHKRMQPANYPTVLSLMIGADYSVREKKILEMCSNRPEIRERTLPEWTRIQHERPVSLPNAARQLIAAARYHPSLEKPKAGILVLSSRGDRLVHPSCSEQLAAFWGLKHKTHPDAGHDLTLDDPEWVLEQLKS